MNDPRPACRQNGFTFVEIIVALGLAAILLPALGQAISFSVRVTSQGEKFTRAYSLAQQEMEHMYSVKSQDWSAVTDGMTTTSVPPFTLTRTVSGVKRNLSENIDPGGTLNPNTKLIHIDVSWPDVNDTQHVTLKSYVTNH